MSEIRAVVVTPGASGNIALGEVASPSPADNQAVVRVLATSLNLGEVRMAQEGKAGETLGWDVAGTVEQVAADGSGPAAGSRGGRVYAHWGRANHAVLQNLPSPPQGSARAQVPVPFRWKLYTHSFGEEESPCGCEESP